MVTVQSFTKLMLFLTVSFLVGCVGDSAKKGETPIVAPQSVNRLIANNITPADFSARTQSIITLSYTSLDSELASSCTVSNATNVSVTQACSCDAIGVCVVGVMNSSAYSGPGSFSYNVVAGGKTSTTGKANFTITPPPVGSNVPPTISTISAKSTTEGVGVSASFTVSDTDSVVSCSNVTTASSNTSVLPLANVVVSGSGGNCAVTVTPAANQIGSSNVTLTLTDTGSPLPAKTAVTTFTLTVTAFNDPPTISAISAQLTNEDTTKTGIAFTINDVDSTLSCSDVTAVSSNLALVASSNVTISGTAPNCLAAIAPSLNQNGTTNITLTVKDHGMPLPVKTASTTFSLLVVSVNDTPVIAPISTQNTTENIAKSVSFTITDVDSVLSCTSSVVITSSNTTLVPNTNISLSGIAPNCVATITPVSGQNGATTLSVVVSDNGFPMPIQSANASFVLNVAQVNHAPTISAIANQVTNEDTATSAIAFTIADSDSVIYCSNVVGTSNNTTLVPNANIVVTGTAPNCIATITPTPDGYGSASITLTLSDNGTPLPALTATSIFTLTVSAVNDAPVLSTISGQTTPAGTASAAIAYTASDIDSSLSCGSSITATSSNTTLIPNANISFAGTAPNCTIVVTPVGVLYGTSTITLTLTDNGTPLPGLTATTSFVMTVTQVNQAPTISAITSKATNEDTTLSGVTFTIADPDSTVYCSNVVGTSNNTTLVSNASIVVTGTAPNCVVAITPNANEYGTAAITLTLTDNGVPLPSKTATSVFTLTVNAVNDAPTISAITNKTTNQGSASAPIAFTINDIDSTLSCGSNVTATSSNTTVIPNANVAFSGTAPNCTAIVTPAPGQYGNATITFTLTDSGTPLPALTATSVFGMTVTQVNQAPVISAITNKVTNEDTAISGITFTISDSDSTVFCNNVTGVSSNTSVVPSANIVISGTAPNCSATITPIANASGSTNITLTITDNGTPPPSLTANSVFGLTVSPVNDAPTISAITNKSTEEDTPTNAIAFTIADSDSTLNCATNVVGTSSNTTLVPNANIVVSGSAPNCSVVITPGANEFGNATITLTLTDNGTPMPGLTATSAFGLSISSVPDISGSLSVAANLTGVASAYSSNSYGRNLLFTGLSIDEDVDSVEVCLGTASGACDVSSWVEATGFTKNGSTPPVLLGGSYRMKSGVGGAQNFTLNASCTSTNNYYYSIRATNASSKVSPIVSTPAWSFWEPSCLGSGVLAMWLDAFETNTVTNVGGTLTWADKSGNSRNVTQTNAAKQPVLQASGMGVNLPGMKFDGLQTVGTGDSLSLPINSSFVYDLGETSVFSVVKAVAVNANRFIFGEGHTANANAAYSPFATSLTNTLTGQLTNTAGVNEINYPTSSSVLFNGTIKLGMIEDTGSSFVTYSNGVMQSQAALGYGRGATAVNTFRLGCRFKNNAEVGWVNAAIGEFIVTNGVLSALNRTKLEGYSAHKWNVSANLPAGHTYLTTPP